MAHLGNSMDYLLEAVLADGDLPAELSDSSDEPMSSDEEADLDAALVGEENDGDDDSDDVSELPTHRFTIRYCC